MKATILLLCSSIFYGCTRTQHLTETSQSDDEPATGWVFATHNNSQRLGIRTSPFGGVYANDQPIPVSIEIRNFGPVDTDNTPPEAQLFSHLDVWFDIGKGLIGHRSIPIGSGNRLIIEKDGTFVKLLDLKEVLPKEILPRETSREYRVSVGHDNGFVNDFEDWTGVLRSPAYTVVIKERVP